MMRVFVAEDSPVVRERLVAMLMEIEKIEVVGESDNPADAVKGILHLRPDIALLDFRLSGGTVLGVLELIRQQVPSVTAIVLTNFANPGYRQRCLTAGAAYFFDKTSEFEKVRGVLENLTATT